MRPLLIGFIICLNFRMGYAQWTKQDSIWLQNVLAGKDTIRLNPEFQKAIKSGTLINPGQPVGKMQIAPSAIPITKDFSEYLREKEDTTHRKIALKDLPPSVFWWYDPPTKSMLPVLRSIIEEIGRRPIQAPPGTFFDLGKMTSRKEYVHKRNAKRDATRKEYDNLPTPDIIRKKKDFTAAQLEAVADSIKRDTTIIRKDSLLLPLH